MGMLDKNSKELTESDVLLEMLETAKNKTLEKATELQDYLFYNTETKSSPAFDDAFNIISDPDTVSTIFPQITGIKKQLGVNLTDIEKGKINKATDILVGMQQSIFTLGNLAGLTDDETTKKINETIKNKYKKYNYEDSLAGAYGEFVFEVGAAMPVATLSWFSKGNVMQQILKQGLFGGVWDFITSPETEEKSKLDFATQGAIFSAAGATVFSAANKVIEKVTSFDIKNNILALKEAAKEFNINPKLFGDFTSDSLKKAESIPGNSRYKKFKQNLKNLRNSADTFLNDKASGLDNKNDLIADKINKDINKKLDRVKKISDAKYNKVSILANKNNLSMIPIQNTKTIVSEILKDNLSPIQSLGKDKLTQKLIRLSGDLNQLKTVQNQGRIIDPGTGEYMTPEIKAPVEFNFKDLRRLREDIAAARTAAFKSSNGFGNAESAQIKKIEEAIDNDIDNWANTNSNNKELYNAYQQAKSFFSANVVTLRDADIISVIAKDPNSNIVSEDLSNLVNKLFVKENPLQEGASRMIKTILPLLPNETKKEIGNYVVKTAINQANRSDGSFYSKDFIKYLNDRKKNLSPFLDEDFYSRLNKYSILSKHLDRRGVSTPLEKNDPTSGISVGQTPSLRDAKTMVKNAYSIAKNTYKSNIAESLFSTRVGKSFLTSAKSLNDLKEYTNVVPFVLASDAFTEDDFSLSDAYVDENEEKKLQEYKNFLSDEGVNSNSDKSNDDLQNRLNEFEKLLDK